MSFSSSPKHSFCCHSDFIFLSRFPFNSFERSQVVAEGKVMSIYFCTCFLINSADITPVVVFTLTSELSTMADKPNPPSPAEQDNTLQPPSTSASGMIQPNLNGANYFPIMWSRIPLTAPIGVTEALSTMQVPQNHLGNMPSTTVSRSQLTLPRLRCLLLTKM